MPFNMSTSGVVMAGPSVLTNALVASAQLTWFLSPTPTVVCAVMQHHRPVARSSSIPAPFWGQYYPGLAFVWSSGAGMNDTNIC